MTIADELKEILDEKNALIERLRAEVKTLELALTMATNDVNKAHDKTEGLTAEVERLRAALTGMIDLAEFWIDQNRETGMSKERYEVWLSLGHQSNAMLTARAELRVPRT